MIETFLFRIKRNFNHLILCRGLYYIQKTTLQRRVVSMHRYVNMIATSLRWSKPDQVQRVRIHSSQLQKAPLVIAIY